MTAVIELMETDVYPGNMSRYGTEDGRTFAWLVGVSATTPWIPPGSSETAAARFIQGGIGQDYWFDTYLNVLELGYFCRWFNFHTIAGYPEWFCGGATSPVALDLLPIGELDGGTDGTNGRATHTKPIIQAQVWGGGTWNSADQCFHGIPKIYKQFEIDINRFYYVRGHISPQANSSGFFTVWIDGNLWFDIQNAPIHWPGVPGLVGGLSGMDLFEGLYEAVDTGGGARNATLQQRESKIQHTISRWGTTLAVMLADTPTWRTHDSSIIVPGVGTQASRVFDTGTTIPDTGQGGSTPNGAPVVVTAPTVIGNTQVGGSLGGTTGTWNGTGITFTTQFVKSTDGGVTHVNVGVNANPYIPVTADVGATVAVIVTATNAVGASTAISTFTAPITAQGTQTVIVMGKTTAPTAGVFVGPDRKRGNSFFLARPGTLSNLFCRLDGLAGPSSGVGTARVVLAADAGPGDPSIALAVSNVVNVNAGDLPQNLQFGPMTFPALDSRHYWLFLQTGGDPVIRAYLDQGIGLLYNAADAFSDGFDPLTPYAVGDGVVTIWAEFAPTAFQFEAAERTAGGSPLYFIQGRDGGQVSYDQLNSAANDTARAALLNFLNPSHLYTVHQRAANDYAFHYRIPGAPAPPANWWT